MTTQQRDSSKISTKGDLIACATRITLIDHFINLIASFFIVLSTSVLYVILLTVSIVIVVAVNSRLTELSTLRFERLINISK